MLRFRPDPNVRAQLQRSPDLRRAIAELSDELRREVEQATARDRDRVIGAAVVESRVKDGPTGEVVLRERRGAFWRWVEFGDATHAPRRVMGRAIERVASRHKGTR